ncbi:response regulator [Paenibacillus mesophilus]|uniref:response regulator n=1 Tax=Paenibacillus mesophilus TaxID=2582849 RepID=UPI00110DF1FE|nr:response regulator [Paenibacillus mesophilus]TMV47003.1 response regulator [Paenibacillus mesophilus]
MIRAVLIDDEEHALDLLDIMLTDIGGVTVVGKFSRAADALDEMARLEADLAFLDIEMPGMNGLAAAERLLSVNPGLTIVFVTAYQHYAVNAFDLEAMDYLLKPVSKSRLLKALDRFHKKREPQRGEAASEETMPAEGDRPLRLRLNVLGSLELYDAGHHLVSWRTRKVKELFAYLWYAQGAPVHRHRIVGDLWPHTEAMRAQPLFHTTLYHLRSLLKKLGYPSAISFADERYVMRTDFIQSDVDRLKELSDKNEGGFVKEWLSLYRGDLLEDEDYPWSAPMRQQVRTDYIRMLEWNASSASGEERESIWRKLITLEPYSETYYDKLLQLLAETGNVAAIHKLYEELRDRLGKELGLQPSSRINSFMDNYR